jgi:hypothetical protein
MIAVFGLFVRAVLGCYARRARARGHHAARTGAITFVQRFGSAANLHVHAHVLVMDGTAYSMQPRAASSRSTSSSAAAEGDWETTLPAYPYSAIIGCSCHVD